jgi:hypothetical protein
MKFQFLNREHEAKFSKFRTEEMEERFRANKEYLSVVFLITGNEELYRKVKPYFNTKSGGFNFTKMFEEQDFSSGLQELAKLAVHLFNSNGKVELIEIISGVDEEGFKLAINSLILRRYGISNNYDIPEEKFYM